MTLIKSISGIRGTIGGPTGDNLTPIDTVKFTAAYATWLRRAYPGRRLRVVVGRDGRSSGAMMSELVAGALQGCGIEVIYVGMATTPTVEMAVAARGADGGIILTASHNPGQWNALKLLNSAGEFISGADGERILALAEADDYDFVGVDELGKLLEKTSFDDEHIAAVLALPLVDRRAIKKAKLTVVLDGINSVGGVVMPKLLKQLGVQVIELNCTPDGRFAHDPEPLAKNLTDISRSVVENGADLGIVVDPDVDRLAFISEDGTMFGEEYTLVAVADYVLAHTPGPTVSNLSSSRALREVTRARGCDYAAAAVGEVNVVAKMKATGAVIGGEGNGGVIYPELHYGRDALVGTALFLTLLAQSGLKMTQLRATYPEFHMSKNKITLSPGTDTDALLAAVKTKYAAEEVDDTDGVKIDFAEGWVHLRRSNTEPIVRVYSEGRTPEQAEALAAGVIDEVGRLLKLK